MFSGIKKSLIGKYKTINKPKKSQISGDGIYRVQELKHIVDNFSTEVALTEIVGLNSGRIE